MASDCSDSLEWIALIGQLKRYMKDGPKATKVQNIIRRMEEKCLEEFEGEDEFLNKLWEIRMSPKQSEKLSLYPIDQDVLQFMNEAHAILWLKRIILNRNKGARAMGTEQLLLIGGLAILDTLSPTTIGVTIYLLLTDKENLTKRLFVYLLTVAGCYFAVGVSLMLGLDFCLSLFLAYFKTES